MSIYLTTASVFARRSGVMNIAGTPNEYDTLVYRKVAPGTTYTQLQFYNLKFAGGGSFNYKMRVHLFTIDMTNPYQSFKPCLNTESYFKANNQLQILDREKRAGRKAVASSAGFMFRQTASKNGEFKSNELYGKYLIDKQVCYSNFGYDPNYYIDEAGIAHLGHVKMQVSAVLPTANIAIAQVNHCRSVADTLQCASLFCNGMTSWALDNSTGVDVILKVNSADGRIVTGTNTCEVMSVQAGCGHTTGTGQCVLSANGATAQQLRALQAGETVQIQIGYVDESNNPLNLSVMNNVRGVTAIKNGEVLPWNITYTAYVCIGISADGKTTYLADIEISPNSNAPVDALSYLLKEIGVYQAEWMDGGPSAEMTLDGGWITVNSIGGGFNGRYIPGAMVLYSTAPDDPVITDIELKDPTARTYVSGQSETIEIYGYNQYGEMICRDAQLNDAVTLTCDEAIGYIQEGTFHATSEGSGFLYIEVKNSSVKRVIPVTVNRNRILQIAPRKLFTGEERDCQLKLYVIEDGISEELDPSEAVWSTNTRYVLKSCENGHIVPYVDGYAEVYASYDGMNDTIGVTVENLEDLVPSLDMTNKARMSFNDGTLNLPLRSVPYSFSMTLEGTPNTRIAIGVTMGNGVEHILNVTIPFTGVLVAPFELDYDNLETYPIQISFIKGIETASQIRNLTAYYTNGNHIETLKEESENAAPIFDVMGRKIQHPGSGLYIFRGKKVHFW